MSFYSFFPPAVILILTVLPQIQARDGDVVFIKDLQLASNRLLKNLPPSMPADDEFGLECTLCQYLAYLAKDSLQLEALQNWTTGNVEKVCTIVPITFLRDTCTSFVQLYGSSIMDIAAFDIKPGVICYDFKLCPRNESLEISFPKEELHFRKCDLCIITVTYLDKLLLMDDIEVKLGDQLANMCQVLPQKYVEECLVFAKAYTPYGLQLLSQAINSQDICSEINLCP